jgi:hypothetical protein
MRKPAVTEATMLDGVIGASPGWLGRLASIELTRKSAR